MPGGVVRAAQDGEGATRALPLREVRQSHSIRGGRGSLLGRASALSCPSPRPRRRREGPGQSLPRLCARLPPRLRHLRQHGRTLRLQGGPHVSYRQGVLPSTLIYKYDTATVQRSYTPKLPPPPSMSKLVGIDRASRNSTNLIPKRPSGLRLQRVASEDELQWSRSNLRLPCIDR